MPVDAEEKMVGFRGPLGGLYRWRRASLCLQDKGLSQVPP